MVTTRSKEYYEKLKILRNHGMEPKYHHKIVGGNFRIDAIQAAVILAKFIHLEEWIDARRNNAQRYLRLFQKFSLNDQFALPMEIFPRHVYNQYSIRVNYGQRDALMNYLKSKKVGCEIYYPIPLHLQECFRYMGYKKGDFPEAEEAAEVTMAIPISNEVTTDHQEYLIKLIREFMS